MVPLSAEASKTASPRRAPLVRDTSARASPRHLGDVRGAPDVPEGPRAPDASSGAPADPVSDAMEARSGNAESGDAGTSAVTDASGGAEATAPEKTSDSDATAADSDSDRHVSVRDAPRVLSPTSKWRVLRTRVRAMSFVERVGKMAAHARPSKLQARAALATQGDAADATGKQSTAISHHRPAVKSSKTSPLPDAPTATFTFTGALDVPDAELDEDVKIERAVLRACLIHGGEFIGDVASVPATNATNADGVAAWRFGSFSPRDEDPEAGGVGSYHLLARTDRDDVELFVELNVVPKREELGDGENENENETESAWFGLPPASFLRKPPMVSARSKRPDEICVAWGRVPWPDERVVGGASGKTEYRVDVPLRGGDCDLNAVGSRSAGSANTDDPEEGIALPSSDKAKKSSKRFFAKFTKQGKLLASGPSVSVRVSSPPPSHASFLKKLPRETLCASRFVPLLATFSDLREREANVSKRLNDTDVDSKNNEGLGPPCSSNPALTTIPQCLKDEHLADALADAWRVARSTDDESPTNDSSVKRTNVEILNSLSLKFWPLLRTGALRDARVDALHSGDVKARGRRRGVIEKSVSRHPFQSLSRRPDLWNHEPFSVAELRHVF